MKVINPFNRVPETEESLALACRCMCSSDSAGNLDFGADDGDNCGCHCASGYENKIANDYTAYQAANG